MPGSPGIFPHILHLLSPVLSAWGLFLTAAARTHFGASAPAAGKALVVRDILLGEEKSQEGTQEKFKASDNNLYAIPHDVRDLT